MKILILFLIVAVGCCLSEEQLDAENLLDDDSNDISCRQLLDVTSTADDIFRGGAPEFVEEVANQVEKRSFLGELTKSNTRGIFKPVFGLIIKLLDLINMLVNAKFSNGDNILTVAKDTIFKAIYSITGSKMKGIVRAIEPIVSLIVTTINYLLKTLLPKIVIYLKEKHNN